ncbi:hypothetical protein [Planctomicrobium piriforme]|uniref:Uncharacterized protein n=1 Tax=Planctomicrobium piriforme TaxID=1576369 RepID=A0A1I3GLR6_9PLAN|nr:hypothetical protein [Planctomicrobium piriforme]SFI24374.1 hypothetical protein SAMN05421753_10746 [Planctomicrobium piriforme]
MREILEFLLEKLNENWVKFVTAGVFMLIGWFIGHRRARRNLKRREFFDRLNVSLNMIHEGRLLIRTLLEKRCEEIFLNSAAAQMVVDAAQRTTEKDPLLPLPKSDHWYFLNSVLNEISEQFAAGTIKRDLGLPVRCEQYVLCLTCEAAGLIKQKKVRAMLIRKALLEKLPEQAPAFESPHHQTRWQTLQFLAAAYKTKPEQFLNMEICL